MTPIGNTERFANVQRGCARYSGENIIGAARIIDGDTVEISGHRIRLFGIDAPEIAQTCVNVREYACGEEATRALTERISGAILSCQYRDTDRYGRMVGQCSVGNDDIGEWMVLAGWALAYRQFSTAYVAAENQARAARRGLWRGKFMPPWEYRQARK